MSKLTSLLLVSTMFAGCGGGGSSPGSPAPTIPIVAAQKDLTVAEAAAIRVVATDEILLVVKTDGSLWSYPTATRFSNNVPLGTLLGKDFDLEKDYPKALTKIGEDFVEVASEGWHAYAIKRDGSLWAWGKDTSDGGNWHTLGTNSGIFHKELVKIGDGFKSVVASSPNSVALKADGSVWGWGLSWYTFAEAFGTDKDIRKPEKVFDGYSAMKYCNSELLFGAGTDGRMRAVGASGIYSTDLATPSITRASTSPVRLDVGTTDLQCAGGAVVQLMADGSLFQWNNDPGVPVQIGSGFLTVGASDYSVRYFDTGLEKSAIRYVSLKKDGSLWSWGVADEKSGALGLGDVTGSTSPVKIGDDYASFAVPKNGLFALAIKVDGALWSWGANENGQLGDGTRVDKNRPVKIGDGFAKAYSNGSRYAVAVKRDGSLWAWGGIPIGEDRSDKLLPTLIGSVRP